MHMDSWFSIKQAAASMLAFLLLAADGAVAQSTDGYHAIQVFPVAVDSASFTQSFHFRALEFGTDTIEPTFYPAGQAQLAPVACPSFQLRCARNYVAQSHWLGRFWPGAVGFSCLDRAEIVSGDVD